MEISFVFGNQFQPTILSHPPPNFIPSASSTTTTVTSDSSFRPTNVSTNYSNNFSVSFKTRQTALLDIQQSSDLDSALARYCLLNLCSTCEAVWSTFFYAILLDLLSAHEIRS